MLLRHLTFALLSRLAFEAVAKPVGVDHDDGFGHSRKREIPASHDLHERSIVHAGRSWERRQRLPRDAVLPMRIGLQQSNRDAGQKALLAISDPKSPQYGKHLSADEVRDMFAPSREGVEAVVNWLTSTGIHIDRITQSMNRQWIQFDANAQEAEDLLYTEYHVYDHGPTGTQHVGCEEYHIPKHVRRHVDYVTPGVNLRADPGRLRKRAEGERLELAKRQVKSSVVSNRVFVDLPPINKDTCTSYVTNKCIQQQYRLPPSTKGRRGNELGIFESLNDHYSKQDLDEYWASLYPRIPKGTYPEERLVDGAIGASETPNDVGVLVGQESVLDFQVALPLIYPQKSVLYQVDDNIIEINQTHPKTPFIGFWNTFYDALDGSYCTYSAYGLTGNCVKKECLDPEYPHHVNGGFKGSLQCGVHRPTNVISISYGGGEAGFTESYARRQCDEIMKLGLQGVTVVISTGDYGVGSYPGDWGYANGCAGPTGKVFLPDFAATCPYLLSVGSTQLDAARKAGSCRLDERATGRFSSGGGFSNYFDTPDYQKEAVANYFNSVWIDFEGYSGSPGQNFSDVGDAVYRIGGRGYPDVAAVGDRFISRFNGTWTTIGGTSMAAPIWAAIMTRINEERLAVGKTTVGFVNPVLYQHPEVFYDITQGSNPGCKSNGFEATKGWDPVTGLGAPNYPKLLKLFMDLP